MNERRGSIAKVTPPKSTGVENQVDDRLCRVDKLASMIADRISEVYQRLEPVMVQVPQRDDASTEETAYCPLAEKLDHTGFVLSYQLNRLDALLESIRL